MGKTAALWLLALTAFSAYGGEVDDPATVSAPVNGTISYSSASYAVDQYAGSVILTVVRSTAKKGAMSVYYSTMHETAYSGVNYAGETGTLNWADGDGSSKTITVRVFTSPVFKGTKSFEVRLAAGPNTLLGAHPTSTVVITGGTKPSSPPASPGYPSFPDNLPQAGSSGTDPVPSGAGLEDTSHPTHVIGNGTASSCTSAAVVAAVKVGGIITFECGPAPVTIQLTQTAQLFNNGASKTVIDGGGLVTLSGAKARRVLYMNTCDESLVWTTSHCNNQEYPQLTVQNLTFTSGNAGSASSKEGGAIYASGGRLKVVNSRFFSNACGSSSGLLFGGAISAYQQYQSLPLYVVHSTFGGEATLSNTCNDGGALGSIGVSWIIVNSVLSYNHATDGGAIYNDGVDLNLAISGSQLEDNTATTYGSSIFFVSDNEPGSLTITDSTIKGNTGGSWYDKYPSISAEADTPIIVKNSTITN